MNLLNLLIAAGLSLLFLSIVFIPLEKAFPAKANQRIFRKEWVLDLSYFLGQYLFWSSLVLWTLQYFSSWLNHVIPHSIRETIQSQPVYLQALEVIVLSDLIIYWGHRMQHKIDFLWRFHKVHHSAETLDWLAAHREHPIDSIYTIGLINLPAFLFGFDLNLLAFFVAFRGIWAIYIHSNVRLPIGKIKLFIGAPELHHWHHDKERDRGNYANISPIMDIIFGTYVCPPQEPDDYGLTEKLPNTYLGQLLQPLLSMFTQKKEKRSRRKTMPFAIIIGLVGLLSPAVVFAQNDLLFPIVEQGKKGYINQQGQIVIPPKYLSGGSFSGGLAPVRIDGLFGYINTRDSFVIPPQFEYAFSFYNSLALVLQNNRRHIIDSRNIAVFDPVYTALSYINKDKAVVYTESRHVGIMDMHSHKLIVDTVYDSIDDFNNGVSTVTKKITIDDGESYRNSYAVIDSTGTLVVPFDTYPQISSFNDGYAMVVLTKDKPDDILTQGVINTKGHLLFQRKAAHNSYIKDGFYDGLAVISLYKHWIPEEKGIVSSSNKQYSGYIDLNGEIVLQDTLIYQLDNFTCRRAFLPDHHGSLKLINPEFDTVIPTTFISVLTDGFINNLAVVELPDDKFAIIDTNGNVTPLPEDHDYDNENTKLIGNFLFFSTDEYDTESLTAIINLKGEEILQPMMQQYNSEGFQNGLLSAVINGRLTYIDTIGNIIWQERKSSLHQLNAYNIDYMNRGYFYAYSKPYEGDLEGFASAGNSPSPITDNNYFPENQLAVTVSTKEVDSISINGDDYYKAYTVYISNTTKTDHIFNAQDSRLYMTVQAKDSEGSWRNIEYSPSSSCGNSYHKRTLDKNYYWKFSTPAYEGAVNTKLRIELMYVDPKNQEKEITIYSNEYDGSINPAQFWRRLSYTPAGVMDPYFE